jgi:hypothetical protein
MKRANLHNMTIEQLVDRFAAITLDQHDAVRRNANAKYNRLFWQMCAVEEVLKGRADDQRRALLPLYDHANAQVRLAAAKATLAVRLKTRDRCFSVLLIPASFLRRVMPACVWSPSIAASSSPPSIRVHRAEPRFR